MIKMNPNAIYTFTYLDGYTFKIIDRKKNGNDWFLYFKYVSGCEGVFGQKETESIRHLKFKRWKEVTI